MLRAGDGWRMAPAEDAREVSPRTNSVWRVRLRRVDHRRGPLGPRSNRSHHHRRRWLINTQYHRRERVNEVDRRARFAARVWAILWHKDRAQTAPSERRRCSGRGRSGVVDRREGQLMRWIAAFYASLRAFAVAAIAGSAQAQAPADPDDQAWGNAQALGTAAAYQQYLEQFPIGRHIEEAFRNLVEEQMEGEMGAPLGAVRGLDMY
jgi:hypothetical protein